MAEARSISTLVAEYADAKAALDQSGEVEECSGPAYDAYEAAETALFRRPCLSLGDVREKATAILNDSALFDTLTNCWLGEEHVAVILLQSLLGDEAAGGGGNG